VSSTGSDESPTTADHTLETYITDVTTWMNMNRLKLNADKTEHHWDGSKCGSAILGSSGPPLQLGAEIIKGSDHVRLLEVTISSDLSPDKHVSTTCSMHFYWVRQIRRIRRSLDTDSLAAPAHALMRAVSTIVTPFWLGRQGPLPTDFNGCSTWLSEWSVGLENSIAACPNCFTSSYTPSHSTPVSAE